MNPLEDLLNELKSKVADEDKEMAERLGKYSADLFVRKLKGEDVDHELDGVKAVALNMSAVAIAKFEDTFSEWVQRRGKKLLVGVLP